ncbi:MAG: T9SS type A sorting domain-containing protein [FCB group bacterium]|nr:T9SS type A sorting domain-containing protein [FCB group bacterium]
MRYLILILTVALLSLGSVIMAQTPPVISDINDTTIAETETLQLLVTATDADGDDLIMLSSILPPNATFVDSGNGVALFEFTPDYDQAGMVNMAFLAVADVDTAETIIQITVTNTNQPPVIDPVPDTTVWEGVELNITLTATDPDQTIPSLRIGAIPPNATFADSNDGSGLFTFRPAEDQIGDFPLTFYADDEDYSDSTKVTITVLGPNLPPVLNPIPDTSVVEGETLVLTITATDPNGTFPGIDFTFPPDNSTLVDNGDGSATFTYSPSYTQGSPTPDVVLFSANDGKSFDDQQISILVIDAGNQVPIFNAVPDTSILEGEVLILPILAADVDGLISSLTALNLPANAALSDVTNGSGTFTFIPDETQITDYTVTFEATDDSGGVASLPVTISVDGPNLSPEFDPIADTVYVTEGDTLNLTISATDANGTLPVITPTPPLPQFSEFPDSAFGSGLFTATPNFIDSGTYTLEFTASDFKPANNTVIEVILVVEDAGNQKPLINPIDLPDTVVEGGSVSISLNASDPDTTTPVLSVTDIDNIVFVDNLDGTAQFDFSPDCNQGSRVNGDSLYLISFFADDGNLVDTVTIEVVVVDTGNWLPDLNLIEPQNTSEGRFLDILIEADDCEGETLSLTTGPLPYNAQFEDYGNGQGRFEFYPDYDQSEAYLVDFYAFDGEATDSQTISITVNNVVGDIANDPGITDTIRLIGNDWDGSLPGFSISCRISNDSAISGASTGFRWDEDWLILDTVELEPWVESAFYHKVFVDTTLRLFHIGFLYYDSMYVDSGNHAYFTARFTYDPDSVDTNNLWDASSRIHIDTAKVGSSGDFVFDPTLKGSPPAKMSDPDFKRALSAVTYAPLIRLQEVREARDVVALSVYDVANNRRLHPGDTIYVDGAELTYQLQMSLENRDSLNEISLGLVMSSEDGAAWSWLPQIDGLGDVTSAATIAGGSRMRDDDLVWLASGGLQFIETNIDGLMADSLLLQGTAGPTVGAGLNAGLKDHMVSMTFTPDSLIDDTTVMTICVNKTDLVGDWLYGDFPGSVITPEFGGEICFPVASKFYTSTGDRREQLPSKYNLDQNYPNPFNPTTTIAFDLARRAEVKILVYNIIGQSVRKLADREFNAGQHTVTWDGRNQDGRAVASGIYLYRMVSEEFSSTRKMILLR